jgi:hypothetical protein
VQAGDPAAGNVMLCLTLVISWGFAPAGMAVGSLVYDFRSPFSRSEHGTRLLPARAPMAYWLSTTDDVVSVSCYPIG